MYLYNLIDCEDFGVLYKHCKVSFEYYHKNDLLNLTKKSNENLISSKRRNSEENKKNEILQIEKDVKRTFGFRKYFKETNPG